MFQNHGALDCLGGGRRDEARVQEPHAFACESTGHSRAGLFASTFSPVRSLAALPPAPQVQRRGWGAACS